MDDSLEKQVQSYQSKISLCYNLQATPLTTCLMLIRYHRTLPFRNEYTVLLRLETCIVSQSKKFLNLPSDLTDSSHAIC